MVNSKFSRNLLFLFVAILFSCESEKNLPSINKDKVLGLVQKGPFISGTEIVMYELNNNLEQTGKSFATNIVDDKGTFQFNNIKLNSFYVSVSANGYYFNENTGQLSSSPLQLNSILDIREASSININILTHLEKPRVEYLISQGKTFEDAKKTAQREIFKILNFPEVNVLYSETLDISRSGDGNAMLLAASVVIQGELSVADLTEFLSKLALDLEKDGVLNNQDLIDTLKTHATSISFENIRSNLTKRYEALGEIPNIPVFEDFIISFLETFIPTPNISGGVIKELHASAVLVCCPYFSEEEKYGPYLKDIGIVYSTSANPTIEDKRSNISVMVKITDLEYRSGFAIYGLNPETKYYARFYAINIVGRAGYGPQIEFTTKLSDLNQSLTYGSVSDIAGNLYPTINIGNQIWMAKNLNVDRYRNGDLIPFKKDNTEWIGLTSGAYSIYNNYLELGPTLGKLYNGYAVTDPRGLCPTGWHVPSESDWNTLIKTVGGLSSIGAGNLKGGLWFSPSFDVSNSSGFTGLPGGTRRPDEGTFNEIGSIGFWWGSTEQSSNSAISIFLRSGEVEFGSIRSSPKDWGYSVRCIKD
jgi:uncharacterized protein (TIGR02145 family)